MKNISIKALAIMAMFAAVISVLSIIQIPTPWGVPFTLQTFSVSLCAYILGSKYGTGSTILYILLGTIGIPVFSGLKAGPAVLVGPTGGYLFGFIVLAIFCGLGIELYTKKQSNVLAIALGIFGLLICHAIGAIRLKFVLELDLAKAILMGSVPYLLKDVLSIFAAFFIGLAVRKSLMKANLLDWN